MNSRSRYVSPPARRRAPRLLAVASILTVLFLPGLAATLCIDPFEDGAWSNDDPNTGGITRVEVQMICNDVVLCGVDENGHVDCEEPSPPWRVHLWGKCHPSDCDWGVVNGQDFYTSDGTKWIYAFYNHGFAKRYVYLKPSSLRPGHLFLWMLSDFTDPGRPDYIMRNWYHK